MSIFAWHITENSQRLWPRRSPGLEEEASCFLLPPPSFVFPPTRTEWLTPFSVFRSSSQLLVLSTLPPHRTRAHSAHIAPYLHTPCSLSFASLFPSTCCWPPQMWPDGAPSLRSLCRRTSSFLNTVVRWVLSIWPTLLSGEILMRNPDFLWSRLLLINL